LPPLSSHYGLFAISVWHLHALCLPKNLKKKKRNVVEKKKKREQSPVDFLAASLLLLVQFK